MRARWMAGVLFGASFGLACGATSKNQGASNAAGSGAGDENASAGNSASASGAGNTAGSSSAGRGGASGAGDGQGGSEISAVGNGELDKTCRMRTTNHIGGTRIALRNAITSE